jgi:hypothetical protein
VFKFNLGDFEEKSEGSKSEEKQSNEITEAHQLKE